MRIKPYLNDNPELVCPVCKGEAVALELESTGDSVLWCENGHVVAINTSTSLPDIVHIFTF